MFPTTPNHTMSQVFFTMMSPFKNHIYILQVQHLMLFFWKSFLGTTSSLVCNLVLNNYRHSPVVKQMAEMLTKT